MKKSLLIALAMLPAASAMASVSTLLPKPQQIATTTGATLSLSGQFNITDATNCEVLKEFFTNHGCTVGTSGTPVKVTLVSSIAGAYDYELEGYENEAYTLKVTSSGIEITAVTATGVIRAAQTLEQLSEGLNGQLEQVNITDWPAFKVRGYMHDVGRSFISFDELKKEVELLARFKVNTFHWHMTENQAWRFEVKQYPALTEAKNMTRFAGSYYTQDQCRELVALAKKNGMIVIPEIDMPGHATAFETAMGHAMQTTAGKEELVNILTEVGDVFNGCPYIHIGADETTITDSDFMPTMTAKVHDMGFKVICWNRCSSGFTISKANGIDMTQMWATSGTAVSGLPNIDCRYNYTNHFDVFADLVGIYKSNIYYAERGNSDIAGSISCYWNDRKTPAESDIINQNNFYANVLATAERCWIGGGKQYIEKGGTTLPNAGEEYEEFADWERRFLFHKDNSLKDEPIPYVKQTNVRWMVTQGFPNNGSTTATFPPETEGLKESYTYNGSTYTAQAVTGAGIYLRHTWGGTVPGLYGDASTNQTAYAYTYVYSPEAQTVGVQIEFQNYGRSEKDQAPANGTWDYKGSCVWVNDNLVTPPTWTNAGKSITNEVELQNENFAARTPLEVSLQKGWNKVLIKLPYVSVASGTVRLNKWMFTCVFTDKTGRNAVDDLIYSPSQNLDPDAEVLSMLISEIRNFVNTECGTEVGYYPNNSQTKALLAMCDEVEATLGETGDATTREQQRQKLNEAYSAIKNAGIVQPSEGVYYYLYTPLRDNRYVTYTTSGITGNSSAIELSEWKFVKRTDGTYNIVNYKRPDVYLSPDASYNSQLTGVTTEPAAGWEVKPADTIGYVIITSGTTELNQTTSTYSYKVYNWGSGTQTSDAGCKYKVAASGHRDENAPITETDLTQLINTIRNWANNNFKEQVGYYDPDNTTLDTLLGKADTAEGQLASMDSAAMTTAYNELMAAYNSLNGDLSNCAIYQPEGSSYYYLTTPLRDGRYMADSSSKMTGITAAAENAEWAFVPRVDGSFDIQNFATGNYVNNSAANNSQITTDATAPATGWRIMMSSVLGYVILYNDGVELNQTKSSQSYAVYNWGYGSATAGEYRLDDTGCQILFTKTGRVNTSGISSATAKNPCIVQGGVGCVNVTPGYDAVVYNLQGIALAQGQGTIISPRGAAIVVANGKSFKVFVR
jgi:hypothetical protein